MRMIITKQEFEKMAEVSSKLEEVFYKLINVPASDRIHNTDITWEMVQELGSLETDMQTLKVFPDRIEFDMNPECLVDVMEIYSIAIDCSAKLVDKYDPVEDGFTGIFKLIKPIVKPFFDKVIEDAKEVFEPFTKQLEKFEQKWIYDKLMDDEESA